MPRIYSEKKLKFLLNLFPPLLFSRVRLKSITPGFRQITVLVRKSILNRNFEKSIFGGTIFSAADPFYALMYWQIFAHEGIKSQVWLKRAEIQYRKPATSHLKLVFAVSEEELNTVRTELLSTGRAECWHTVNATDESGELCAEIRTLIHLRLQAKSGAET